MAGEWQPMYSAPKDGRKVLLLMKGTHMRSARWFAPYEACEASDNDDIVTPIAWMEMPFQRSQK